MKINDIFEARVPGLGYEEIVKGKRSTPYIDRVVLTLEAKDSEIMTKMAMKYKKLDRLMKSITQIRNDMNEVVKNKMDELFDAEDIFRTRVIETVSATMTLAKKGEKTPASVKATVDYEKVALEIMKMLDNELLEKAKVILNTYTSIERVPEQEPKSPALRVEPKESVNENILNKFKVRYQRLGHSAAVHGITIPAKNEKEAKKKLKDKFGNNIQILQATKINESINEALNWNALRNWAHKFLAVFEQWGKNYDKKIAHINQQLSK